MKPKGKFSRNAITSGSLKESKPVHYGTLVNQIPQVPSFVNSQPDTKGSNFNSKSFLLQSTSSIGQPSINNKVAVANNFQSDSQNKSKNNQKNTQGSINKKSTKNQRGSVKSLASKQNRINSQSSKCLLSTMGSNWQQFSSEKSQQTTNKNQKKNDLIVNVNKIYFTSQESQEREFSSQTSQQSAPRVQEFSDEKPQVRNQIIQENIYGFEGLQIESVETDSRRESLLSSFNESEMNEGVRVIRQDLQMLSQAKEVKTNIMSRYRNIQVDSKSFKEGSTPQLLPPEGKNTKVFEIKQIQQPKGKNDYEVQDSQVSSNFCSQIGDSVDLSSRKKIRHKSMVQGENMFQYSNNMRQSDPHQMIFLSRIDHNALQNDSKPSESELGLLFNFSTENHNHMLSISGRGQRENSLTCKNLALCCFSQGSIDDGKNLKFLENNDHQNNNGMIRVESALSQNKSEKIELSLPVDLDDDNEYISSEYSQKVSNQSSNDSKATQGIKQYLTSLKNLRSKYKDICHDLVLEENMNIQATTKQVIASDEYKRLSLSSRSVLLARKIIDIRDEYRNVLQLLKSQHNFDAEIDNEEGFMDMKESGSQDFYNNYN